MIVALQTLVFFRESILNTLDRLVRPYYSKFLPFGRAESGSDDEETEEVFAEYDDEKGVVFFPPLYLQRYAAVFDCLMDERWRGKLEKVVDFGYNNMAFIKYLKDLGGVQYILGVDLEGIPLQSSSELFSNNLTKTDSLLQIVLYQGNAADPDYRLIGCDAVVSIEMIEHMLPHDLDRLLHTVFGFIKPRIAVFTTPNGDFNVLFKALEANGLRRMDHFFEWSREQFYDWCSNIVVRYPGYTVSCKGVGPGPAGTEHLGCCSQLALFVAKDYHKQEELNLDSLALVAKTSDPNNVMTCDWEVNTRTPSENNMICAPEESFTDTSAVQKSSMSVVLSPKFSLESIEFEDKIAQCNMDKEIGKSFLMFDDEEMCYNIVVPRRQNNYKVYEIEDVTRRLNCTSLQVTKFSSTTKNVMSKNKTEHATCTSEMIEEIRQLTKMLNLNKSSLKQIQDGGHTWCNINWGDNAPYWNQYYKLVKEYSYPFETKNEESRILDAISEEVNRLLDTPDGAKFTVDGTKLEVPMEYLMTLVQHITTDVDKVKDILEWNGYEIYDNVLIHSRLMIGNVSESHEEEWHDNETYTESDATEIRSTTLSDGSNYLRRALDKKVQKLRSIAEEDITVELDRVFSQLLNMALKRSKDNTPIPTKWLQCKLLDLLTLTEKAIERRKLHIMDKYTMKCIEDQHRAICEEIKTLNAFKEDCTGDNIVDKYRALVDSPCEDANENILFNDYIAEVESLGDLSSGPPFVEEFENAKEIKINSSHFIQSRTIEYDPHIVVDKIERIEAWMNEDPKLADYDNLSGVNNSDESDHSEDIQLDISKTYKRGCLRSQFDHFIDTRQRKGKKDSKHKLHTSNTKIGKKLVHKKSSICNYTKSITNNFVHEYGSVIIKSTSNVRHQNFSKPIPGSIVRLRCSEFQKICKIESRPRVIELEEHEISEPVAYDNISATENVDVMNIVTAEQEETIVLRRAIGTDAQPMYEDDTLVEKVISVVDNETNDMPQDNIQDDQSSRAIFLIDINEPSTSKGIRHVNLDAQCGPDLNFPHYSQMTTSTSFNRIPSIFNVEVKTKKSMTDLKCYKQFNDFGTSTSFDDKIITPTCKTFYGITIKDSLPKICSKLEGSTNTDTEVFKEMDSTFNATNYAARTHDKINCSRNLNLKQHNTTNFLAFNEYAYEKVTINTQTEIIHDRINVENVLPEIFHNTNSIKQMVNAEIRDESRRAVVFSPTETILKPVTSDMKIDSGSGFNVSVSSSAKSILNFSKPLKKTSYCKIKSSISKEVAMKFTKLTKYVRPKLSCGGTHVHSYKERQESEDIMYLGKWDKQKPRAMAKKLNNVPALKKDSVIRKRLLGGSKDGFTVKQVDSVINKMCIQMRNAKMIEARRDAIKRKLEKQKHINKLCDRPKGKYTTTKVPSSITKSNITSDHTKISAKFEKKPLKNYLPLYLRRNIAKQLDKENLVQRFDMNKTSGENKQDRADLCKVPIMTSKAEEIKNKHMLNYRKYMLNRSFDSAKTATHKNEEKKIDKTPPLVRCKTDKLKNSGLKCRKFTFNKNNKIPEGDNNLTALNREAVEKDVLNKSFDSAKKKVIKEKKQLKVPVKRSKTEDLKDSLLNYKDKHNNVKVAVYRNEINGTSTPNPKSPLRSLSNSRCTSPNSIVSVQQINTKSKDTTSSKRQSTTLENESIPKLMSPNRKELTKSQERASSTRSNHYDKENKPLAPKSAAKTAEKKEKTAFVGQNTSVFMAQLNASGSLLKLAGGSFKNKSLIQCKSINKHSVPGCTDDNKPLIDSVIKKSSMKSDLSSNDCSKKNPDPDPISQVDVALKEDNNLLNNQNNLRIVTGNENLNTLDPSHYPGKSTDDMKKIIEDSLEFIESSDDSLTFDSATVILSHDDVDNYEDASPTSYKTVLTNDDFTNENIEKELENALNNSFDFVSSSDYFLDTPNIPSTINELDVQSFRSVTSSSRMSGYVTADNDLQKTPERNSVTPDSVSVRDIFERKDINTVQNPVGTLASQAFSGFSVDAAPVTGDQPDYVNLVDSETGSLALNVNRQVASEEVFISGRSSDSFATCQLEEDAVVPNWLFNIITRQQSEQEDAIPTVPEPFPPTEPLSDVNGNMADGMAASSGAGDGQGVHSDRSQDSSGRGSSISSSVTTSDSQSDALLIDPYTGQFEMLQADSSRTFSALVERAASPDSSLTATVAEDNSQNAIRVEVQRPPSLPPALVSSDGDADVSSLDTDNHDSDN